MLCSIILFVYFMKYSECLLAQKLRRQGKSYSEILRQISVSKGTLSLWLRDVELTETQKKRLFVTLRQQNVQRLAKRKREEKKRRIATILQGAKKEIDTLLCNPLFLSGAMLYWAEGDKSEQVEAVKFSNSDPQMIALMMRWFRKICRVQEQKFRIALHIHELHNENSIKNYWSRITNIPLNQFHKTQIKQSTIGHRKNYLYNGTCSIRISDKDLFRRIHGWKTGIVEYLLPRKYQSISLQRSKIEPTRMSP